MADLQTKQGEENILFSNDPKVLAQHYKTMYEQQVDAEAKAWQKNGIADAEKWYENRKKELNDNQSAEISKAEGNYSGSELRKKKDDIDTTYSNKRRDAEAEYRKKLQQYDAVALQTYVEDRIATQPLLDEAQEDFYRKTGLQTQFLVPSKAWDILRQHTQWFRFGDISAIGKLRADSNFGSLHADYKPVSDEERYKNFRMGSDTKTALIWLVAAGLILAAVFFFNAFPAIDAWQANLIEEVKKTTTDEQQISAADDGAQFVFAILCILCLAAGITVVVSIWNFTKRIIYDVKHTIPAAPVANSLPFNKRYSAKSLKQLLLKNYKYGNDGYNNSSNPLITISFNGLSDYARKAIKFVMDAGFAQKALAHEDAFDLQDFPDIRTEPLHMDTVPHPLFYVVVNIKNKRNQNIEYVLVYAGIDDAPYYNKEQYAHQLLGEVADLTALREKVKELKKPEIDLQLEQLHDGFFTTKRVLDVLYPEANEGYKNALGVCKEVYHAVLENVNRTIATLENLRVFADDPAVEGVKNEVREGMLKELEGNIASWKTQSDGAINALLRYQLELTKLRVNDPSFAAKVAEITAALEKEAFASTEADSKKLPRTFKPVMKFEPVQES